MFEVSFGCRTTIVINLSIETFRITKFVNAVLFSNSQHFCNTTNNKKLFLNNFFDVCFQAKVLYNGINIVIKVRAYLAYERNNVERDLTFNLKHLSDV